MTLSTNFWQHCAMTALQISKNIIQRLFDFLLKNVWYVHINATTLVWLLTVETKRILGG